MEPVHPVAADVLELPDHPSAPAAAASAATSSTNPNNARLQRRATVPAAAIPCAAGLRSRAAWKKAIAAAQTARAVVEGGEASTPRSKGSSERQDSAQKTVCPFSRRDLQRESAVTVEASKLKPKSVAGEAQEARIAEELQQLQDLQDQQERRLTHVLGKSQQLSAGLDSEQRGESTEEAKPRKVKDPKVQVVQECKDATDSPSRGLRAAAAFASDRAAPDLEPSLWDQLLQEAEEAQQGAQGAQKAQEAPKVTAAKRRSSPRRKGRKKGHPELSVVIFWGSSAVAWARPAAAAKRPVAAEPKAESESEFRERGEARPQPWTGHKAKSMRRCRSGLCCRRARLL